MPANGYTVGRDVSLDIGSPTGVLRFSIKTGWKATPKYSDVDVNKLDGENDHLFIPKGWDLQFDYERSGNTIDNYFAQAEADYYAGLNALALTVTETIREPNGGVSQFRYTKVQLKYGGNGDFKGDTTVKQTIMGSASRRLKVS
jgi:hypothetical protein